VRQVEVTMATQYRVIQDYVRKYHDPISFAEGEVITRQYKDDEFPGWWWCTDKRGKSGWVHESYFCEDDYRYIASHDYSAKELSVKTGESVVGLGEVGGWLLAQSQAGELGWVPLAHVQPVS